MALITSNTNSLSGNITMDIDLPGSSVTTEVTSMGEISFEFDLVPTESVTTFVGGIPGACTVQIRNTMSNRGSFYDAVADYIGEYDVTKASQVPQANVNIKLVDRLNPQNTYYFPFTLRFQDLELDERSDIATLKLSPKSTNINLNTWVDTRLPVVNEFPSIILPYRYASQSRTETNNNTVPVGDFIYDVVGTLGGPGTSTNIYETATNIVVLPTVVGAKYGTRTNVGCDAFPRQSRMVNLGNGSVISSFIFNGSSEGAGSFIYNRDRTVMEFVQMFAGMEGAIFGSAFSANFYINRTSNTRNVEISIDDLADLKFVSISRAYNAITMSYQLTNSSPDGITWSNANVNFAAWPDATQQAKVSFTSWNPFLIFGCFEADAVAQYGYTYISNSGPIQNSFGILNTFQDAMAQKSFSAFSGPLGVGSSYRSGLRIEFDILGATKLKPWETIKFDSTVPERYQGKHFRPTSLQYDFKSDRIRGVAYQVDTFPYTPPATTTTTTPPATTTTTASPATTTTTAAPATTTTTSAPPIYIQDNEACSGGTIIAVTFQAGTNFCTTETYSGDFSAYPAFSFAYLRQGTTVRPIFITTSDSASQDGNCATCSTPITTTTTSAATTTTTTTAAPTTTTTTAAATTTTTTAGITCNTPTIDSVTLVSGSTLQIAFTSNEAGETCSSITVRYSNDPTFSTAFSTGGFSCSSPIQVDVSAALQTTVYIQIRKDCSTPNTVSDFSNTGSYTF